ncbi:hypothetical protein WJ96_06200 [Burkholderia ubonensis]|uniref:Uncharacterized protein n=1 Tax=Burkholderia ubonensis TaxID=101571 RepID=A0AAW3MT70_9BURK|nr:hypothetical protein [Burkholderia ubonensis]KVP75350.1 hypothetical protein WJ93_08005 [Burkholderia ubonensis]KVP98161.1 hypothetical protein WJ96_06200 [Burkholderia ubonensis]KVZ92859.1 hypothetical protein WL25_17865 [Burkholderia ubonensis]
MGLLARLFQTVYRFKQGDQVNLVRNGLVARFEGVVVAHTRQGVLVDWPTAGADWMDPGELVRLVPDTQLARA